MKIVATLCFVLVAGFATSAFGQHRDDPMGSAFPVDLTKSVSVYPNPAIEYLHVKFEEPIARKSKLTVHNIIGNVLDVEMELVDEHELRLRVKDLPVGYYLLALRDDQSNSRGTIKFVKR